MIGLRIGAEELSALQAGAPAVVLAPGVTLPAAPPLLMLELHEGLLTRPGTRPARILPLPADARLSALVAPNAAVAAQLAPLLPAGLPVVSGAEPLSALLGLLARALQKETSARLEAEAAGDACRRLLGDRTPPEPELLTEAPPVAGGVAPARVTQPLGRAAEGICTIELHLAAAQAGAGAQLRARLTAAGRILGAWVVPGPALAGGWLALDLPEPAPPGAAEGVLEVALETGPEDQLQLSAAETTPQGALALRIWTAAPGRHVLPLHFDWAALGAAMPRPGLALSLPIAAWEATEVTGAEAQLVAAGAEPPRLLLDIAPGSEALLAPPPVPKGPADLLRARLAYRGSSAGLMAIAATAEGEHGSIHESGWREMDETGELTLALPLPTGPMARLRLMLRNDGPTPAVIEVSQLALMAGAAGERRRAPAAPLGARRVAVPANATRVAVPGSGAVGFGAPLAMPSFRTAPPQPPLTPAGAGGPAPGAAATPSPSLVPPDPRSIPVATAFRDLKLQQHLVNADGSYRHLDIMLTGLVAAAGLWRQVRLKLFERRGTIGLEFREMKGWPQMFDVWPAGQSDNFGPFWRLETQGASEALAALSTPHDRALIGALMDVLPDVAQRGAVAASLPAQDVAAWTERAQRLAEAVTEARSGRR